MTCSCGKAELKEYLVRRESEPDFGKLRYDGFVRTPDLVYHCADKCEPWPCTKSVWLGAEDSLQQAISPSARTSGTRWCRFNRGHDGDCEPEVKP